LDQAIYEFQAAANLVPQNIEYLTAQELTRQHLAGIHLEQGNEDLLQNQPVEAMAEFRTALTSIRKTSLPAARARRSGACAGAHCGSSALGSRAPTRSTPNPSR